LKDKAIYVQSRPHFSSEELSVLLTFSADFACLNGLVTKHHPSKRIRAESRRDSDATAIHPPISFLGGRVAVLLDVWPDGPDAERAGAASDAVTSCASTSPSTLTEPVVCTVA